jgi:sodium-type flagellar protein MotY
MNKSAVNLLFSLAISVASLSCAASLKTFEAPLDESRWNFSGNPLDCKLSHSIPFYGDAEFHQEAGKNQQLAFSLGYKRHKISAARVADVRALPPAWHPSRTSRELGQVEIRDGGQIFTSHDTASWRLLNELEVGRFPTFYYQDFNELEDQVSVALSAVGFKAEYDKFLTCLTNLVPFKIDELSKLTVYFDFDRTSIKDADKNRLYALAQYVKYDPSIEVVFIEGHTDDKGSRSYNDKLSAKRVETVKKMLQLEGVSDNRFKTNALGERKPAVSNRSAQGRAKNRRVYISLAQF